MKRTMLILSILCLVVFLAFPQASGGNGAPKDVSDSAQQMLVEVSVNRVEDAAYWTSDMPHDQGMVQIRRFEGTPKDKEPLTGEDASSVKEQDRFVLGAKVQFLRRAGSSFAIYPVRPLPIEGLTKTLSVWVVGRNYNHVLKAVIEDYFGRRQELTFGKLNFMGWKKLTVAIPPSIVQDEFHFVVKRGIKFVGFRIDADLKEAYGTYYIYFDDLRAVTDLFDEYYRDTDDMPDSW